MRSLVIPAPGEMTLEEAPIPGPAPGEILVRVAAAGICAGDLHIYRGKNPYALYPCVGGHEMAGVVVETGERVVVEPFLPCRNCYPCSIGKENCCENLRILGVHRPGGYAEYVSAPADRLHPVPDGLSMVWASFAEPIAIAVHAARRADVGAEDVLVLGCGPIGLAVIEVARARGARVFATDPDPSRLAMAVEMGASPHPGRTGYPVVVEATGVPVVIGSALDLVAPGGRVVVLGLVPGGVPVSFAGLDLTRKEATILGSRASVGAFPEALVLLASGRITYPKVATELPLEAGPATFAQLAHNPAALHKGVFVLTAQPPNRP